MDVSVALVPDVEAVEVAGQGKLPLRVRCLPSTVVVSDASRFPIREVKRTRC